MSTPDRWRERAAQQHRYHVVRNPHDPLYAELDPIEPEHVRFDSRFVIDALLTCAVFFLAIVVLSGMGPK